MDVSAIKNTLSKEQIRSKIPTISALQVFSTELHPSFHFLGFFLNTRSTWECLLLIFFFFFFFDCNVSSKNLLSLFLHKIRRPLLFTCKLITFNSKSINLRRKTAVNIVLDVSQNSHLNVYSEVLRKVVAYQHGFVNSSRLKFPPDF